MDKPTAKKGITADKGGSSAASEKLKRLEASQVDSRSSETFSQLPHSVRSADAAGTRWAEALIEPEGDPAMVEGKRAPRAVRLGARQRGARILVPAQHPHSG